MSLWGLTEAPGARDDAAAALLLEWVNADCPLTAAPAAEWVERFRALGGFVVGDRIAEHERPRHPLRLYRAASARGAAGLSWTPYRLTAASYGRLRNRPVWTAVVPPEALLAAFPGAIDHGWDELVIDPADVEPLPFTGEASWATRAEDREALRAGSRH